MTEPIKFAAQSHTGLVRENNEALTNWFIQDLAIRWPWFWLTEWVAIARAK
jgi:hypothetical protein